MLGGRFSSSIGPVGVDIGAGGLRLLQLREHGGLLRPLGAARIDFETEAWTDAASVGGLVDQLRSAVATGGFTGRRCVVSLPRREVRIQSIRLPVMPETELRQAATWEAAQRFGMDRESMQVDFVRTGAVPHGGEQREEVILIAASHASLHRHLDPLLEAGLRPVAADTDFGALGRIFSRQLRRQTDLSQVRAVVDVGASGSSVMILRGDQLAFCKGLAIGGQQLSGAVVEHLQLDERAARELRIARIAGAGGEGEDVAGIDPSTDRAVFEAVRPLMGDLVKEIILCLRYYGVTFRGHPPQCVHLAGGDGLEPGLDRMIERSCKIPTAGDDGQRTLEDLVGRIAALMNRDPGPPAQWAVAAGLAVRGLSTAARAAPRGAGREAA